ncbi:MAG: NifB/NifX family molybdenum-iron cluster-binding protein [Candidatus Muiribacteriaceae bacterium]
MRIAITSSGKDKSAKVDPRFGRALGFIVYDSDKDTYEYVENMQVMNTPHGAGVQASRKIIDLDVQAVITGHVGPNAFRALNAADIDIYLAGTVSIEEAVSQMKSDGLKKASDADVAGHWV